MHRRAVQQFGAAHQLLVNHQSQGHCCIKGLESLPVDHLIFDEAVQAPQEDGFQCIVNLGQLGGQGAKFSSKEADWLVAHTQVKELTLCITLTARVHEDLLELTKRVLSLYRGDRGQLKTLAPFQTEERGAEPPWMLRRRT